MAFEEQELKNLSANLHDTYRELEQVSGAASKLTPAMLSSARSWMVASGEAQKLAEKYLNVQKAMGQVFDAAMRGEKVSLALTRELSKNAKSVRELAEQYKKLEAIQKYVDFQTKSFAQKTQTVVQTLGNFSKGVTNLTAKLSGLTLSQAHLTETLQKYNSTQFEAMRIGERYGDSMESHAKALDIVSKRTAFSRQEFEDLNSTIKQMTVGLPMTSKAVADLAANFSGKFGWSAERVKKAIQDLIPLQNKLPDLFNRISKVAKDFSVNIDKGAKSAHELRNQLRAIGASQNEIETAMSAVRGATPDTQAWVKFEETISKSKRNIADSGLAIAEKMQPGLEAVAKSQALIAKTVASLPSGVMLAVGAFSMMGATVAAMLGNIITITANVKAWGGLAFNQRFGSPYQPAQQGGTKGEGLVAAGAEGTRGKYIRSGRALGIATALGVAGNVAGSYLERNWADSYQAQSYADKTKSTRTALSRGLSYGSTGASLGFMVGGVPGAIVGGLGGAAIGGFMGWKAGDKATKEQLEEQLEAKKEEQKIRGSIMAATAQAVGVKVYDDTSQKAVLEAVKKEKDEHIQKRALQELYATGQIKEKDLYQTILSKVGDENKARKETDKLVKDVHSSAKSVLDVEMQIERVALAKNNALETQLVIINKIKESGQSAIEGVLTGDVPLMLSNLFGGNLTASAKNAAENAKEQFVSTFVAFNSDNKALQSALGDQNFMKLKDVAAAEKELNRLAEKKVEILRKQEKALDEIADGRGTEEEKEKESTVTKQKFKTALAPILEDIDKINSELTKAKDSLDWGAMFKVADVEFQKLSAEFQKMSESGTASATEMEAMQTRIAEASEKRAIVEKKSGEMRDLELKKTEAPSRLKIQLLTQQKEIGSLLIAQAEKLGMPQSYKAIQDQMKLIHQERKVLIDLQDEIDNTIKRWGVQDADLKAVIGGQMSMEDALAKAGVNGAKYQQDFTKALMERQRITKELTSNTNELYDITKVWREGWMDAMSEFAIGAGDFTATIGIGNQNVTEKLAAGGLDTARYGGTNRQNLSAAQMMDVRYGQATRFTPTLGTMGGNAFSNPNPLMRYSGVLAGLGNPERNLEEANRIAEKGIAQVNMNGASDAVMGQAMAQVEQAINNGDLVNSLDELNESVKSITPKTIIKEYSEGIKQPNVHQPGGAVTRASGGSLGMARFGRGSNIKRFSGGGPTAFWANQQAHWTPEFTESFNDSRFRIREHLYGPKPKIGLKNSPVGLRYNPLNDPSSPAFSQKISTRPDIRLKIPEGGRGHSTLNDPIIDRGYSAAKDPTTSAFKPSTAGDVNITAKQSPVSRFKHGASRINQMGMGTRAGRVAAGVGTAAARGYLVWQGEEGARLLYDRYVSGDDSTAHKGEESLLSRERSGLGTYAWILGHLASATDIATQGENWAPESEKKRGYELDKKLKELKARQKQIRAAKAREEALGEAQKNFQIQQDREVQIQGITKKHNVGQKAALAGLTSEDLQQKVSSAESKLNDSEYQEKIRTEDPETIVRFRQIQEINSKIEMSRKAEKKLQHELKINPNYRETAHYEKNESNLLSPTRRSNMEHDLAVAQAELRGRLSLLEIKNHTQERSQKRTEIEKEGIEHFKNKYGDKLRHMTGVYDSDFGQYYVKRGKDKEPVVTMFAGPDNSNKNPPEEAVKFKKRFDSLKSPDFELQAKREAGIVPNAVQTKEEIKTQQKIQKIYDSTEPSGSRSIPGDSNSVPFGSRQSLSRLGGPRRAHTGPSGIENYQIRRADGGPRQSLSRLGGPRRAHTGPSGIESYQIRADGGMIEPGSYVVKTSAAQANAGVLNEMGASWVTGGIPGQDSVMFGIGMAAGGSANYGSALLMPGEAIVPPSYAAIGEAINSGLSMFAKGGSISDEGARKDILSSTSKTFQPQTPPASSSTVLEFSPEVAQLLRFQDKADFNNGSRV